MILCFIWNKSRNCRVWGLSRTFYFLNHINSWQLCSCARGAKLATVNMGSKILKPSLETLLWVQRELHTRHGHSCWCKSELSLKKPLAQNECKSPEACHLNGNMGANKGCDKWLVRIRSGRIKGEALLKKTISECLFVQPLPIQSEILKPISKHSILVLLKKKKHKWITLLAVTVSSPASTKISEVFVVNSFQQRMISMKIDCVICRSIW